MLVEILTWLYQASGGDADDEDFYITIKFMIFAKPEIDPVMDLHDVRNPLLARQSSIASPRFASEPRKWPSRQRKLVRKAREDTRRR